LSLILASLSLRDPAGGLGASGSFGALLKIVKIESVNAIVRSLFL
jgi:hypothetical protein